MSRCGAITSFHQQRRTTNLFDRCRRLKPLGLSAAILLQTSSPQQSDAQEQLLPGRLPREVRSALAPGLMARFVRTDHGQEQTDLRVTRMAALYVPSGSPATPFLKAGPFRAVLEGYLRMKLKGDYVFGATGKGRLTFTVNGQPVLVSATDDLSRCEPTQVALVRGYNHLRIEYESPATGDAQLRLHWSPPGSYAESVPPEALSHDSSDPQLRQALRLREGRRLVGEHRCLKCHTTGADPLALAGHMPELDADAPDLSRAGERLTAAWMARWILDPAALRTHVTMPAILTSLDSAAAAQQAVDMAVFLATLRSPGELSQSPEPADAALGEQGAALFETLGCVACHLVRPPEEDDLYDRTKLYSVDGKFRPGALAQFLLRPHAEYAWSRMPDFKLSQQEAAALAAYLREQGNTDVEPVAAELPGDVSRGRVAFGRWGCANCHNVGEQSDVEKLPLRKFGHDETGCLSDTEQARGAAPDHALTDDERAALRALIAEGDASLARSHPAEAAGRMITQLRCVACHRRDEQYSYLPEILLEESSLGLPPEIVPPLSWAGEKLQAPWMEKQLAGALPYRPRPWLKIRMPAFPHRAEHLAHGLAAQHGIHFETERPPELKSEMVEIGRQLSLKEGGFYCVQCHGLGSTPAEGAFDARGVNFSYVADRLRHEYYLRWMANPLQYEPATKMPKFSPDGATSPLGQVYDGDATRQFDALWQYLHSQRTDG